MNILNSPPQKVDSNFLLYYAFIGFETTVGNELCHDNNIS